MVLVNDDHRQTRIPKAGYKVVLGAGDLRAAAIDQLQIWADRVGVPIVKQNMGLILLL
jgi:signal recognition particle GTPase